jgi:hypothetical protein
LGGIALSVGDRYDPGTEGAGTLDSGRSDGRRGRFAALALVVCLHLLTTPGTWLVSDHAEMLHMARRLVGAGTFTLGAAGEPLRHMPWVRPNPDGPTRSRLFPGTAIVFAPVVFVEGQLGWGDAADFGPLTRLTNHALVWGALALLAAAVRRRGASEAAAAVMVVLLGTAWPLWQISRHAGAEPVLAALVAVFLWADAIDHAWLRAASVASLPWVHPTGSLLALSLSAFVADGSAWSAGDGGRRPARRRALVLGLSSAVSSAAVLLLWNLGGHGQWLGGYGASGFFVIPPWESASFFLREGLLLVPLLVALAIAGAVATGRGFLRPLGLPLSALALHLLLFAIFSTPSGQEPARRLATVWLLWGFSLGRGFDALRLSAGATRGLLLMGALLGFYWFEMREWNYYPAADGGYYPLVAWVTLAVEGRPAWQYLLPVSLLLAGAALASWRLSRELSSLDGLPRA